MSTGNIGEARPHGSSTGTKLFFFFFLTGPSLPPATNRNTFKGMGSRQGSDVIHAVMLVNQIMVNQIMSPLPYLNSESRYSEFRNINLNADRVKMTRICTFEFRPGWRTRRASFTDALPTGALGSCASF